MKPTLYLETTVPSYLTAWSSRDVVMLAHQQVTHEWWESRREAYEVFISQIVLDEAAMGDTAAARRRLALLTGFPLLDITQEVERLKEAEKTTNRVFWVVLQALEDCPAKAKP